MPARTRFSTAPVVDSNYLVPWLGAEGPLAYNRAEPPAKDYFFQYTWILPGTFDPHINLREHRYFGSPLKQCARFPFDFWANARSGCSDQAQPVIRLEQFAKCDSHGAAVRIKKSWLINLRYRAGSVVNILAPVEYVA